MSDPTPHSTYAHLVPTPLFTLEDEKFYPHFTVPKKAQLFTLEQLHAYGDARSILASEKTDSVATEIAASYTRMLERQSRVSKFFEALSVLLVWNPELWNLHPNVKRGKQLKLYYQARGIVEYDRVLTGDYKS